MAKEVRKITLGFILSWILGILFILSGLGLLILGGFLSTLCYFTISFILLPPANKFMKEKMNLELSRGLKIVLVIILMIVAFAVLPETSSDLSQELTNTKTTTVNRQKITTTTVKNYYEFEESFILGNYKYTFNKMYVTNAVGDYFIEEADGIFIVLDLTIENMGKESKTLWSVPVVIMDEYKNKYEHDSTAEIYAGDMFGKDTFNFEQIQPRLPKTGILIFDVPEDITGYFVVSSDGFLSDENVVVKFKSN